MNKYLKEFLLRGLIFGGFGPIVMGIIYAILERSLSGFSLSGSEIAMAIISTYLLAFLHAGASVFNVIENWPLSKSLLCHFVTLYIAYTGCYLINSWIPFIPKMLLIFTLIFSAIYFVIWLTVYFCIKLSAKKLNNRL